MKRRAFRFDRTKLAFLFTHEDLRHKTFVRAFNTKLRTKLTPRLLRWHLDGTITPSADMLGDYATFFGVPVDYFYSYVTLEIGECPTK